MPMTTLNTLPAELRLRIYDFVLPTNPLSRPRAEYTGLLYSCRFVRQELEPEILKRMIAFLYVVQKRCRQAHPVDMVIDTVPQDMEFDVPQDLPSLYNLRVKRPCLKNLFMPDDPILALMYMHFNVLTFVSHPDPTMSDTSKEANQIHRNMAVLSRWIGIRPRTAAEPAANKIVCDWSEDRQNLIRSTNVRSMRDSLSARGGWAVVFRYHWEDHRVEGVEYMRSETVLGKDLDGCVARAKGGGGRCTMKDGVLQYFHPFDKGA